MLASFWYAFSCFHLPNDRHMHTCASICRVKIKKSWKSEIHNLGGRFRRNLGVGSEEIWGSVQKNSGGRFRMFVQKVYYSLKVFYIWQSCLTDHEFRITFLILEYPRLGWFGSRFNGEVLKYVLHVVLATGIVLIEILEAVKGVAVFFKSNDLIIWNWRLTWRPQRLSWWRFLMDLFAITLVVFVERWTYVPTCIFPSSTRPNAHNTHWYICHHCNVEYRTSSTTWPAA